VVIPIQVLIIEDSPKDAALLIRELAKAGYEPHAVRVDSAAALRAALDGAAWDLCLADYVVPSFGVLEALAIVRERGLDMPFIIVSGVASDEAGVTAMRAGAHDFIAKDRLARLGAAVARELSEAEVRSARRRIASLIQALVEGTQEPVFAKDQLGRYILANEAASRVAGCPVTDMLGKTDAELVGPEAARRLAEVDREIIESGEASTLEQQVQIGDACRTFLTTKVPYRDAARRISGVVGIARDITDRVSWQRRVHA
jgi:PAS domain S-box-containing protein